MVFPNFGMFTKDFGVYLIAKTILKVKQRNRSKE
jgi:hypothetical protein